MSNRITISATQLPDASQQEMDFVESSFFKTHGPQQHLPTPEEVRIKSQADPTDHQPPPVRFEQLNLIVKFGPNVTLAEGQCLRVIRNVLRNKVPVPEVYGWRVDGREVFIYMELIPGKPLSEQWDSLTFSEKTVICDRLHEIMASLREVQQDPSDPFIGVIRFHKFIYI